MALAAFAVFCALSGAVYLLNDIADRERDRLHPTKRLRPIASGQLPVGRAATVAVVLIVLGLAAAWVIGRPFAGTAVAYVLLLAIYSVWLKHLVIADVLTVALGFVLRAVAGALAIGVVFSGWLVICTLLLALFLALGKRRHEYLTLGEDALRHRPILAEYSAGLLDQMIAVVTASTVTAYALYTMSPETVAKFHTNLLPATLPFVLYGIFRYLYLLYRRQLGEIPRSSSSMTARSSSTRPAGCSPCSSSSTVGRAPPLPLRSTRREAMTACAVHSESDECHEAR